ncbi:MAG: hypothetical protein ACRDBP_06435 [Luteolibacter sp.]
MLAIGDLQTAAGVDQRVTAPGGVLGTSAEQQRITGVWKSKKLGPKSTPADFEAAGKTKEFVRWLVSGADTDQKSEAYAQKAPGTGKDVLDLVSKANLDAGAPVVQAKKVAIMGSGASSAISTGSFAYAVLDEGQKARVNLGINRPSADLGGSATALGGGQRPSFASVKDMGALAAEEVDLATPAGRSLTAKMISVPTSEFAYKAPTGKMNFKLHDLTTNSQGVLVDVANGGLKKDFSLLSEETEKSGSLPTAYNGVGIYKQSFDETIISDPSWARAIAWSRLFGERSKTLLSNRTVGGMSVPTLTASSPPGWVAGTGKKSGGTNAASAELSKVEPTGPVLLPAIAKVQMSFALAARDLYRYGAGQEIPKNTLGGNPRMHDPWHRKFQENLKIDIGGKDPNKDRTDTDDIAIKRTFDSPYDYLLHMVYSPVITLHNPYTVPIAFTALRVEFVNVPFAFQVFRSNEKGEVVAQTSAPVPFSLMYSNSVAGGQSKRFGLTLTATLLPGEVKVFSPGIPSGRTWDAEVSAKNEERVFWDWGNRNSEDGRAGGGTFTDTSTAAGIPGWNGPSVGYDLDFIAPDIFQVRKTDTVGGAEIDRWSGIPLKKGDEIYVESSPIPDSALPKKEFSVEMTLNHTSGKLTRSSALIFEYDNQAGLQGAMMANNPQAEGGKIRAPKGTDKWTTEQLYDHASVSLKNIKNTQPFALFSAYAKTTLSGSDAEGKEGLWAAKPFSFQNHTSAAISQKVTADASKGHPSHFSHELALSRFPELGLFVQGGTSRGLFITGHSDDTKGRRMGSLYEVPISPLQSFSTLNGAQLASSVYLPHFSAPIGNSYAHPLLTGTSALETGPAGNIYADHSFLLNSALYDSYYFSGLQTRATAARFGDGKTRDQLVDGFLDSSDPKLLVQSPLTDQNLKPYYADGILRSEIATTLKAPGAYTKAAAYQVIEGAFNVNSISVNAWKAVLSAMTGEGAVALLAPGSTAITTTITKSNLDKKADANGARFSRFRTPNGQSERTTPDGFWRGPIDLSEGELDSLAKEIVKQVQTRGPFLSMAEFVNRQLGPAEEKTLAGALQTAIDKSGINTPATAASAGNFKIGSAKTGGLSLKNAKALEGDSTQGAPGFLMQSDVLSVLGNAATVRSDTFKIRAYGEAVDKTGKIIARAYCEAVVQRNPEFVDPLDKADKDIKTLVSLANQKFGRKYSILSVRWLSPSEI